MDIFKVLDEFESIIQSSKKVPMTGKILISEEVLLDFLDRIRTILPEEIRQAKLLSRERERVIQEAREEAERILAEVREEVNRLTSESELTKQAQAAAEEIVSQARRVAREIRNGATEYADEILRQLEGSLDQNLSVIRRAREELSQMK
ncbi:MAG: ATPase [Firmicutes bacterium]|nr:ATPase [Bacillota bacterium]